MVTKRKAGGERKWKMTQLLSDPPTPLHCTKGVFAGHKQGKGGLVINTADSHAREMTEKKRRKREGSWYRPEREALVRGKPFKCLLVLFIFSAYW